MKKNYIVYTILVGLVLVNLNAMAQLSMSAYYLENVPQSNYLNAAITPRANAYVGLPFGNTIYTSFNSDISTSDLFQKQGDYWATPLNESFDYKQLYQKMGKTANIDLNQTVAPLVLGFRTKKGGYVTFGIIDKAEGNIGISKAVFNILDKGLPNGSVYDLSTMKFNLSYYREYAFGYSQKFTDRLTLGVHAKALFGMGMVSTDIKQFDFNVSNEEWSYVVDGQINGSFPVDSITYADNGFIESVHTPEMDDDFIINNMVTNFSNPGLAFDLGAVYELSKFWKFSAAVNDLGFISWKGNVNNFKTKGNFVFQGLDFDLEDIGDDGSGTGDIGGDIVDSLKNSIAFSHNTDPFVTYTTPRMYLGAEYSLNHYFSAGVIARSTFYKDNFQQEINMSANLNLYHFLTTSINYNFSINGRNSLGLGVAMRASIFQFYFVADYVPYSYRSYSIETTNDDGTTSSENIPGPEKLSNLNMMFGLNFLFGANGFQNEPMIDAYSEF